MKKTIYVSDLIDTIISHNEIVAIWEPDHSYKEFHNGRYSKLLWKGMAWNIPKEYSSRLFHRIFGTIPESIDKGDTINILVY